MMYVCMYVCKSVIYRCSTDRIPEVQKPPMNPICTELRHDILCVFIVFKYRSLTTYLILGAGGGVLRMIHV